jgi:hypothetical protein
MELRKLSTMELKELLNNYKSVSMGVKDIIFTHQIEDELEDRRIRDDIYYSITGENE